MKPAAAARARKAAVPPDARNMKKTARRPRIKNRLRKPLKIEIFSGFQN
jgi:hypothetical protein